MIQQSAPAAEDLHFDMTPRTRGDVLVKAADRGRRVRVLDQIGGPLLEQAWTLYHEAFKELNALAVQRHGMYRNEFDDIMGDERVRKYLSLDGDEMRGLATYTNQLDAMPLISPAYFARRWPQHYAQRRIWYCGFVAVAPAAQGGGAFAELVTAMYRHAETQGGIISLDICRHNDITHHLPRAIRILLAGISAGKVRAECADVQQFWVYETAPS